MQLFSRDWTNFHELKYGFGSYVTWGSREKVLVTIFFAVCYFKFMESIRCADGVVYGVLAMPLSECNLWNFILKVISHGITAIKTTYVQYAQ